MPKMRVAGWEPGLQKVKFNKLLQEQVGYSLREAKHVVDGIVNGEEQLIDVAPDRLSNFVTRAKSLGARIEPLD